MNQQKGNAIDLRQGLRSLHAQACFNFIHQLLCQLNIVFEGCTIDITCESSLTVSYITKYLGESFSRSSPLSVKGLTVGDMTVPTGAGNS